MKPILALFFGILILSACSKPVDENYLAEIEKWRSDRAEYLTKPDSWFSLAGLFWLEEGENTFGTDKSNNIIFPKGTPFMGTLILIDSTVTFQQSAEKVIGVNGEKPESIILKSDLTGEETKLTYGSLLFYLIERDGKYGIRLKDSENDDLKNFAGLNYYPVDEAWKLKAKFTEYNPPKEIIVPTVLGTESLEKSPGYLGFEVDSQTYKLDVLGGGKSYFVIFADITSGEETYGAGRFLTVEAADSTGYTFMDFNKAYNPPCAYTKYATCPLPPKDNYLKLSIEAGEKKYH